MSRRVPLRHSLVTRLLLTVIGVLVVAVGATAWLATQTATRAIRQEQGRSLADEKGLYEALVGYAATHPDWSGAGPLLHDRARALGRRVTLTTAQRQVIADSGTGPRPSADRTRRWSRSWAAPPTWPGRRGATPWLRLSDSGPAPSRPIRTSATPCSAKR